MQRVRLQRHAEPIHAAIELLDGDLRRRLDDTPIMAGSDPVFAGLHGYEDIEDGRSYRSTMHVAYAFHVNGPASRRETTLVIPEQPKGKGRWFAPWCIVHELGHVLDEMTGFSYDLAPVSEYARTNRFEAFAEQFRCWAWGRPEGKNPEWDVLRADGRGIALFEALAWP